MAKHPKYGRRRLGLALTVMAIAAACIVSAGAQVWALPFVIADALLFVGGMELMSK